MICEFEFPDVSLRCLVARQLLSRIYALSSVKFPGLKLRLCKKNDKNEVCGGDGGDAGDGGDGDSGGDGDDGDDSDDGGDDVDDACDGRIHWDEGDCVKGLSKRNKGNICFCVTSPESFDVIRSKLFYFVFCCCFCKFVLWILFNLLVITSYCFCLLFGG